MMRDESTSHTKELADASSYLADLTGNSTAIVSASHGIDQASVFSDFKSTHPSLFLSRAETTEVDR